MNIHKFLNREYCVAVCRTDEINCQLQDKDFKVIRNGFKYWAADPFPVEVNGSLYVFAEIFQYSKVKGSIGYTKRTKEGFTKWKIIIDEPFHLSFPNIFCLGHTFYMCPEAHESGSVYLYRCIEFPEKWVKDQILFKSDEAVDTIFIKEDDEVYGMTCIWNGMDRHTLKIFKIEGENCEFSDQELKMLPYYMSRPAGKIFYDKTLDENFVVSQICKPKYGSGLVFKKYSLNWPDYSEEEYKRILPDEIKCDLKRRYDGAHTVNTTEHYIVIDLAWSRINFFEKACRIVNKIKKRGNKK